MKTQNFVSLKTGMLALLSLIISATLLGACSTTALPTGLTARMDQTGAVLDRAEALTLINQYRAARGVRPLQPDAGLDAQAQALATQYAANSTPPSNPDATIIHMRLSAGYTSFAETFSGWRGISSDADAIADANATIAGLGVAYSPNSAYGVHWVLLLGNNAPLSEPVFSFR